MQKITGILIVSIIACCTLTAQKYNGIEGGMDNIYKLSDVKTHSISPENFNGPKDKAVKLQPAPAFGRFGTRLESLSRRSI